MLIKAIIKSKISDKVIEVIIDPMALLNLFTDEFDFVRSVTKDDPSDDWKKFEITFVKADSPVYQHYKGGIYTVSGIAKHSETLEELVIYQNMEEELWARPKEMFFESVESDDKTIPRFKKL